ncbi:MAG: hypothetical protein LBC35_06730 [Coriobacteriales bacterium]|jgi:hypothetical protein|nr:hypothetical protein [Coriobacteriales bacterium]
MDIPDISDSNNQRGAFGSSRAGFLLDSAVNAHKDGNKRLAIHLYCAAFEASVEQGSAPNERVLTGLRQAWMLACEQGDRSTAEAIFNDLIPYNSTEQTKEAMGQLQGLAIEQLAGLGLDKADIEDMALSLTNELREAGVDLEGIAAGIIGHNSLPGGAIDLNELSSKLMAGAPGANLQEASKPAQPGLEQDTDDAHFEIRYGQLAGFDIAKTKMREFGIVDPNDKATRSFIEQAESFHGIVGPVLSQNFLFSGPSREDNGVFAQATATEIGWPVVMMIVDINDNGDGTIKVMAPVRRAVFGPPRIPELPNPCTLVIQNIDILQNLFWGEEQALSNGHGPMGFKTSDGSTGFGHHPRPPLGCERHSGGGWRSLKGEILSYLGALEARGGVFVIATSANSVETEPLILGEELDGLIGPVREIGIDLPNQGERIDVLRRFSQDHPSFHDLDLSLLASLSGTLSRYELILSCRRAVEYAYSESLKHQRHQMVTLEDVLKQLLDFIDRESTTYKHIEDYLVERFAIKLEEDIFAGGLDPNQLIMELDQGEGEDDSQVARQ